MTILTDRPERHPYAVACDVRDPRALIDAVEHLGKPDAIFSNSDHLQTETALAASYFGLPAKDWRACAAAKNKFLMRRKLLDAGIEQVFSVRLGPGDPVPDLPCPVVLKPREGVASEDVMLVERDLAGAVAEVRKRRPGEALVVEEYLEGPLRTLETLGDADGVRVLGGFETTLGALPYFVEERLDWAPRDASHEHVLAALRALGVRLGACHTEYVVTDRGPRIVEVNYRVIGDHCDFLMGDILGVPLFEWILRAHLGERVPELPGASAYGSAVSLVADRTGTIKEAPGHECVVSGDVRLWHRPLRDVGDVVSLTHTNRDYLGVVRAVGPDRARVEAAVEGYRAARPWVVE
ncbi:ATP-grasp domain-containing protein [Nonomuraea sp. NPDC050643]|uniref:ATP-grasp domain-containing protein n=1 Tax=Nonomuraea sp. NPDC050643 TaxID=3155660 RepID=UPI0033FFAA45